MELTSLPQSTVTDAALHHGESRAMSSGTARIRVIPPLPWSYNFDNGEIPVTWVGIRYRHIPIDFELLQKLKKQNPHGQRALHLLDEQLHQQRPARRQIR